MKSEQGHNCNADLAEEIIKLYRTSDSARATLNSFVKEVLLVLLERRQKFHQASTQALKEAEQADTLVKGKSAKESIEKMADYLLRLHGRFPKLVTNMCLVYLMSLVEAYLSDLVRTLRDHLPKDMKASSKKYAYQEIIEGNDELKEMVARRHVIVHKNGKVDKQYLEEVHNSTYELDGEISLDYGYLQKAIDTVEHLTLSVCKDVLKEFCNVKHPEAFILSELLKQN